MFWCCPFQISSLQYFIESFWQFWGGSYVTLSSFSLSKDLFCCQSVLISSESFYLLAHSFCLCLSYLGVIFEWRFSSLKSWSELCSSLIFLLILFFDGNGNFIVIIMVRKMFISWLLFPTYFSNLCFCIWGVSLKDLFLNFWCWWLLCCSSFLLVLALEEWERFLVLSSSILWLSVVFIAWMMLLEIWLPSVVMLA